MVNRSGRPRSEAVDKAIIEATLHSLLEAGFSGTTLSGVARNAGVSTATIYRRYQNLDEVVIDALVSLADQHPVPDTGSLDSDLRSYLHELASRLNDELGSRLISVFLDEVGRNQDLADAYTNHISEPGRDGLRTMFARAVDRGEIRADSDLDMLIDLTVGALYYRHLEQVRTVDDGLADRIADVVLAGVQALNDAVAGCSSALFRYKRFGPVQPGGVAMITVVIGQTFRSWLATGPSCGASAV